MLESTSNTAVPLRVENRQYIGVLCVRAYGTTPATSPLRLRNKTCVCCGAAFGPGIKRTREHVIGTNFVPDVDFSSQWNLIVNACGPCNVEKSDLEGELAAMTMQPDVFGRHADEDEPSAYNRETQQGGWPSGCYAPLSIAPKSDWGSPIMRSFQEWIADWPYRVHAVRADGYFKLVIVVTSKRTCGPGLSSGIATYF